MILDNKRDYYRSWIKGYYKTIIVNNNNKRIWVNGYFKNKKIKNTDFPQTKLQKTISDFWNIRGYSKVMGVLGNLNISFHKSNPKYEANGLCYTYLESFYIQAKKELIEDIESFGLIKRGRSKGYILLNDNQLKYIKKKHIENERK